MLVNVIRPELSQVVVMENGDLLDLVVKIVLSNENAENQQDFHV